MIAVVVNGERTTLAAGTSLSRLVSSRVDRPGGVAVARNDAVVPRSEWEDTRLDDGDRIEILVAAQGG